MCLARNMEASAKTVLVSGAIITAAVVEEPITLCALQSTYTGVYKKGGPSTVEPSRELSSLLDRSPADVRGIKRSVLAQQGDSPLAAESPLGGGNGGANSGGSSFRKPPMIKTNLTPTHGSGRCALYSTYLHLNSFILVKGGCAG